VKKTTLFIVTGLLLVALSIGACGGGGAKVTSSSTTLGQELVDLKEAYDKGIISEKEYEDLKKEAIKKKR